MLPFAGGRLRQSECEEKRKLRVLGGPGRGASAPSRQGRRGPWVTLHNVRVLGTSLPPVPASPGVFSGC